MSWRFYCGVPQAHDCLRTARKVLEERGGCCRPPCSGEGEAQWSRSGFAVCDRNSSAVGHRAERPFRTVVVSPVTRAAVQRPDPPGPAPAGTRAGSTDPVPPRTIPCRARTGLRRSSLIAPIRTPAPQARGALPWPTRKAPDDRQSPTRYAASATGQGAVERLACAVVQPYPVAHRAPESRTRTRR